MRFWRLEPELDEDNVGHIRQHGVEPEEVEEIVFEDCHPSRILRVGRRGMRASILAVERKRVPRSILYDADRPECFFFSGYDPSFRGDEPPGL